MALYPLYGTLFLLCPSVLYIVLLPLMALCLLYDLLSPLSLPPKYCTSPVDTVNMN
jgi:hypothetical protein